MRFVTPSSLLLPSAVALLLTCVPSAKAQTIDFNGTPNGTFLSYTESGVTFTAVNGTTLTSTAFGNTPNGTRGLISSDFNNFAEIRASIFGGASFVSVDLGDYNVDADTIFLQAFDAGNNSVGFTSQLLPTTFTGMNTLSLSGANIASVIFGSRTPSVQGSSVYADNFTFRPAAATAVPEPSEWLAMGMAGTSVMGLMVRARRRRTSKTAA